jgi:hypothetical protein
MFTFRGSVIVEIRGGRRPAHAVPMGLSKASRNSSPTSRSGVLADVNRLLDKSFAADGFRINDTGEGIQKYVIDLAKIDFETLAKRYFSFEFNS